MSAPRDSFGLVGTTIADRVRVERVLGEGGFGVVYAGTHLVLGAPVAIKCLKPSGHSEQDQQRAADIFLREGRILFQLTHPAIVRLYDVGVIPGAAVPYAVLELISGRTLSDEIKARAAERRPFTQAELAAIFLPILEGVGFAHERGVVHRDLKPSNIMLVADASRVTPKVLDFGTARGDALAPPSAHSAMDAAGTTGTLGTGFTPLYAAPEQWDGSWGKTGPSTDVYALGVTLAEACLLAYPLPIADNLVSICRAAMDETARPRLDVTRPDLSPELGGVIHRAMRVRPQDRFADARDMLVALRRALDVTPSTAPLARPLSAPPPVGPSMAPPGLPPPRPHHASMPPGHALVGSSTTQPHALSASPSYASGPSLAPPPQRSPLVPLMIGAAGLFVAIVAGGLAVGIALTTGALEGAAARPAAPAPAPTSAATDKDDDDKDDEAPDPTAVPDKPRPPGKRAAKPGAPPASPTTPGSPATAPSAPPPVGPVPRLVLRDAIGMKPFWTQAEVKDVARAHHAELEACIRKGAAVEPNLGGLLSITVHPNKSGTVESVQCALIDHKNDEVVCDCAESAIGKWRFPPSHGKLGALDAAPFIYDYKLVRP